MINSDAVQTPVSESDRISHITAEQRRRNRSVVDNLTARLWKEEHKRDKGNDRYNHEKPEYPTRD